MMIMYFVADHSCMSNSHVTCVHWLHACRRASAELMAAAAIISEERMRSNALANEVATLKAALDAQEQQAAASMGVACTLISEARQTANQLRDRLSAQEGRDQDDTKVAAMALWISQLKRKVRQIARVMGDRGPEAAVPNMELPVADAISDIQRGEVQACCMCVP